ncbi:diguanylate cyclase [Dactylosporangium sp. AC04546]|uniref:diguanylate cyclase domain-containing protein n=1 Tax=Dactylosporangium sp. AC04546 TaxID=2862460 RepID=UPI001EDE0727|nr:diguanylate cyclase [Dactylosporangium sp. AC04546]WVK81977.1 diguanylate cyclase [Dactylosporangium sp. AC04546]
MRAEADDRAGDRAGDRARRRRRWAGAALVAAVVLAGLGLSAGGAAAVRRVEQRYAAQTMDRYTEDVSTAVTERVERYSDTLLDLAGSIGAQPELTAAGFAASSSGLNWERLPGASGVAFAVPGTDAEVPGIQRYWREHGVPTLTLAPVGTGTEHAFAVLSRPFDGVAAVAGRDLTQAPEAAEALRVARDSGEFAVSRAYVLLKDRQLPQAEQQLSFTLAVPVRNHADGRFRGWVVMGLRGGDFLNETLRSHARGAVRVLLTEGWSGAGRVVASVSTGAEIQDDPLNRRQVVTVGQRHWELALYPTDRLLNGADRRMAALTLGAGLVITLLLGALVAILSGARNRAMAQVDEATAALREDIERREETEQRLREREHELQRLAFHDPLTGLANRVLFYERVQHALLTHARERRMFAVLFVDLDGFKQVNDGLGHAAGDAVLREVAIRLRNCVRASDTVARFGGDEFAIMAEQLADPADVRVTANRIVKAMEQPFHVGEPPARISASVGIALNGAGDADAILKEADEAMYLAKTAGKNRFVLTE